MLPSPFALTRPGHRSIGHATSPHFLFFPSKTNPCDQSHTQSSAVSSSSVGSLPGMLRRSGFRCMASSSSGACRLMEFSFHRDDLYSLLWRMEAEIVATHAHG